MIGDLSVVMRSQPTCMASSSTSAQAASASEQFPFEAMNEYPVRFHWNRCYRFKITPLVASLAGAPCRTRFFMDLTNTQRVMKLAGALIKQPRFTLPYLLSDLSQSRHSPLSQNLPWWSFAAIDAADTLFPGRQIFEWGTGGSTLRYAKMGCKITAIEDDQAWLEPVKSALVRAGVADQVSIHYIPFNFDFPQDFASSSYCLALTGSEWDVVIIDGQDKTFRERITCFRHAEPLMKPSSIILVDDFWRYSELLSGHSAKSVKVFESVGPCRIGVTSTAMFFY